MLFLRKIDLVQFKNYSNRSFTFSQKVIGISGDNGVGKTNLLDAIHYLCFTRSYFSRTDAINVMQGQKGFRIQGELELNNSPETATCILRETGKKEFQVNQQPYDKFSQHIGRYPCVVIAPDDAVLIAGPGEERRKFLDSLLSQIDSDYLQQLIKYTKVLQQRNALLKSFAETGEKNLQVLDVFDDQLIPPGQIIFEKRKEFLVGFLPLVKRTYQEIAQQVEELSLLYESQLHEGNFGELLKASRQKDIYSQRTQVGPHRDEIDILLGTHPFRSIASQGQRKSLLFALKLTEMEVLKKEKGFSPFLLLDDVFEKLDESRISNLLKQVCAETDGQVFITDTHEERLTSHLDELGVVHEVVRLKKA